MKIKGNSTSQPQSLDIHGDKYRNILNKNSAKSVKANLTKIIINFV